MSTWLVNSKMDPALAERIDASVVGRRKKVPQTRSTTRVVSLLRFLVFVVLVAIVGSAFLSRHRERAAFQLAQTTLLDQWRTEAASLTDKDQDFVDRVRGLLATEARAHGGDFIAEEFHVAEALKSLLARPSVYVRGAMTGFANSEGVSKLAAESGKDAFLLCLLDPPTSATEKAFLPKARLALGGGPPVQNATPNVRRLADAVVGLPYLSPAWGERIRQAKDLPALQRLERALKKAPLQAAKIVSRAELLVAVLDEPNDVGGVTELDGEHAHSVRVILIELVSNKTLIRLRKHVDPSWVTPNRRSQYARELDSCKLAREVHDALELSRP